MAEQCRQNADQLDVRAEMMEGMQADFPGLEKMLGGMSMGQL